MANKNSKKYLYILIGVLVLGGLAFGLSKGELFKGLMSGLKWNSDIEGNLGSAQDSTEDAIKEATDEAAAAEESAAEYAEATEDALAEAETSFEDNNRSELEAAQEAAEEGAENARNAANSAEEYANKTSELYDTAVSEWEDYSSELAALETAENDAEVAYEDIMEEGPKGFEEAFKEAIEAEKEYETCLDLEPWNCEDEEKNFNDLYDNACDAYGLYSTPASDCSIAFDFIYEDAKDALTAYEAAQVAVTEYEEEAPEDPADYLAYLEAALESAENADTYAIAAEADAEKASGYSLLYCHSLTLSPSSFTMLADQSEASFDLTVNLELGIEPGGILPSVDYDYDWSLLSNSLANSGINFDVTSNEAWFGNLIFEANGYGEFTYNSKTDNPLKVEVTEEYESLTISFAGGVAGDTILVYAEEESNVCLASFDIDQVADTDGNAVEPTLLDTDADGLTDNDEISIYGTYTSDPDSDDDGLSDYEEVSTYGTNPLDADSDDDNLSDYSELITYSTDPNDANSNISTEEEVVPEEEVVQEEDDNNDDENEDEDELTIETSAGGIIAAREINYSHPFTDVFETDWHEQYIAHGYQAGIVRGRTSTTFVPDDNITRAEWIKIVTLVFGLDPNDAEGETSNFLDVSENEWYYNYVVLAEMNDIARTRDEGYYFDPNEDITRADALLFAIRAAGLTDYDYDIEAVFDDVDNDDYFAYALAIANETIVTDYDGTTTPVVEGYLDGTFDPYNTIARSEAMAISIRAALAWGIASGEE